MVIVKLVSCMPVCERACMYYVIKFGLIISVWINWLRFVVLCGFCCCFPIFLEELWTVIQMFLYALPCFQNLKPVIDCWSWDCTIMKLNWHLLVCACVSNEPVYLWSIYWHDWFSPRIGRHYLSSFAPAQTKTLFFLFFWTEMTMSDSSI